MLEDDRTFFEICLDGGAGLGEPSVEIGGRADGCAGERDAAGLGLQFLDGRRESAVELRAEGVGVGGPGGQGANAEGGEEFVVGAGGGGRALLHTGGGEQVTLFGRGELCPGGVGGEAGVAVAQGIGVTIGGGGECGAKGLTDSLGDGGDGVGIVEQGAVGADGGEGIGPIMGGQATGGAAEKALSAVEDGAAERDGLGGFLPRGEVGL